MGLEIPMGFVERLPDAAEVRFAVRGARRATRCLSRGCASSTPTREADAAAATASVRPAIDAAHHQPSTAIVEVVKVNLAAMTLPFALPTPVYGLCLSGQVDCFPGIGEPAGESAASGPAQRRRIRASPLSERALFGARPPAAPACRSCLRGTAVPCSAGSRCRSACCIPASPSTLGSTSWGRRSSRRTRWCSRRGGSIARPGAGSRASPGNRSSDEKFVTSTTSVLPSHRPRESPHHWRTFDGRCGRSVIGITRCHP